MTKASPYYLVVILLSLVLQACSEERSSADHVASAWAHMEQSRLDHATAEARHAIRKDRNSAEARWLMGNIWLLRGDAPRAVKELRAAAQFGWPLDDVAPVMARALLQAGHLGQVLAMETQALDTVPKAKVMAIQARAELISGQPMAAQDLVDAARQLAPDLASVTLALAALQMESGRHAEAESTIQRLLDGDPLSGEGWALLGQLRAQQGRLMDALQAYNEAIAIRNYDRSSRFQRALLHLRVHDFASAGEDASELLRGAPLAPEGNLILGILQFRSGAMEQAITALTRAETAHREHPLALFYLGLAHFAAGNADAARKYSERYHFQVPGNIAGRKLLAVVNLQSGQYDKVEDLLAPVLEERPNDQGAIILQANAAIKTGHDERGFELLMQLASLQALTPPESIQLGSERLQNSTPDSAAQYFESALPLAPEFRQTSLLRVISHLQRREWESAVEFAQLDVQRNPGSVTARNLLGRAYLDGGKVEAARETFSTTITLEPGNAFARLHLARMAEDEGSEQEAREHLLQALEADRKLLPALLGLARLEASAGHEQSMIEYLQRAMNNHPDVLEPRLMLCRHYLASGQPEQALWLLATLPPDLRESSEVKMLQAEAQLKGQLQ